MTIVMEPVRDLEETPSTGQKILSFLQKFMYIRGSERGRI